MTVFDLEAPVNLAYGMHRINRTVKTPTAFRAERARPYLRAGKNVQAVPQFATLTLYSPIATNNALPSVTAVNTVITRPGRSGLKFP